MSERESEVPEEGAKGQTGEPKVPASAANLNEALETVELAGGGAGVISVCAHCGGRTTVPLSRIASLSEIEARVAQAEAALRTGKALVAAMDLKMPEQATEDEDGFIKSYRIPVGPWHRLLAWAQGSFVATTTEDSE